MGGSAAETPASPGEPPVPGLRASDAEREQVVSRLRDEFIAGRLSHETFLHRMHVVLESRRLADLPPVLADLPAQPAPRSLSGWLRGAWSTVTGGLRPSPRGGGDQFSIGRDASCDLAIPDMTVSRRHAQLERTKDGWLINDLESTN